MFVGWPGTFDPVSYAASADEPHRARVGGIMPRRDRAVIPAKPESSDVASLLGVEPQRMGRKPFKKASVPSVPSVVHHQGGSDELAAASVCAV
jgi:hypothetical protein